MPLDPSELAQLLKRGVDIESRPTQRSCWTNEPEGRYRTATLLNR